MDAPSETNVVVLPVGQTQRPRLSIVSSTTRPSPWLVFLAGGFLVSVPVFFEAPLVRYLPGLSLGLSGLWAALSLALYRQQKTALWGDLLVGFTWTWLCGAIFWGWMRWDPTWHIPIEAAAMPVALWGIQRSWAKIGNCFYLGSLFGTAITDLYFYVVDLMPSWKALMRDPSQAPEIFHAALAKMYMPWGMGWAAILASTLLFVGLWGLKQRSLPWIAFSGAVLFTLLVDGLFWLAAVFS